MFEAVGWEKGTLESNMGENPVDDVESSRSVELVMQFSVCLSQYPLATLTRIGQLREQTSTRAGFEATSALGLDFFFGASMPKARCDSLNLRQTKMLPESRVGLATQSDQQGGNSDTRTSV